MSLLLCVAVAAAGWAMEVAHPVFFAREPLVLWARAVETVPVLFFCGEPWPARWCRAEEGGRVRWEADLRHAPLGIWTVCVESECFSFLRVEDRASIVEIRGAPPGARVLLDRDRTHIVSEHGTTFFVVDPGPHTLVAEHHCGHLIQSLDLRAGERKIVRVGEVLGLRSSSAEVLPGHKLRISLRVRSALPLPYLQVQVALPPGWRVVAEEDLFLPVPAGAAIERGFVLEVPPNAPPGAYPVVLSWHGQKMSVTVEVVLSLSPLVVVGHWDVREGKPVLTAPFALTLERVLWAASLLGQPIPYSAEVMTAEVLRRILEIWASGEAR